MGVESQAELFGSPPDQCRHDSLLCGPHSLPPALLAAEVTPAQAVSVPPQHTVSEGSLLPGAVLQV